MIGFIILVLVVGGIFSAAWWYDKNILPGLARKQRDRQIETALRRRMYDREAARRIGRRMLDDDEF